MIGVVSHVICKNCEINGSETNHNCLLYKDDFFYEYDIINTNYKNCYNNSHTKNRTEIIQNIINNFISEFNIINLYNGKYIKIVDENLIIKLTSTSNQKNNEEENNITIDLCQCENILKEEYNILKFYIIHTIKYFLNLKINYIYKSV